MKKLGIIIATIAVIVLILIGKNSKTTVAAYDTIQLHYTIQTQDGTILMTTSGNTQSRTIHIGSGQILPGLDKHLIGLHEGQRKTITLSSNEARGQDYNTNKQEKIPMHIMQDLGLQAQAGTKMIRANNIVYVQSVDRDYVTIDYNPDFTRQDLIIQVHIVKIIK